MTEYGNTAQLPNTGLWIGRRYFNTDQNAEAIWSGTDWVYESNNAVTIADLALNIASAASNTANAAELAANAALVTAQSAFSDVASAANTVAVYQNGTLVVSDVVLNFNNSSSINVAATANGSEANVAFSINTSMNLLSVNVASNAATGNLNVSQNVAAGNVSVSGNLAAGGLNVVATIESAYNQANLVSFVVPMSNYSNAITTGQAVTYLRSPFAFTLQNVYGSLMNASTSGNVTVQIRKNGSNVLNTILQIDTSSNTSVGSNVTPVINVSSISFNDLLFFDIIAAGTNAYGLSVTLNGAA